MHCPEGHHPIPARHPMKSHYWRFVRPSVTVVLGAAIVAACAHDITSPAMRRGLAPSLSVRSSHVHVFGAGGGRAWTIDDDAKTVTDQAGVTARLNDKDLAQMGKLFDQIGATDSLADALTSRRGYRDHIAQWL